MALPYVEANFLVLKVSTCSPVSEPTLETAPSRVRHRKPSGSNATFPTAGELSVSCTFQGMRLTSPVAGSRRQMLCAQFSEPQTMPFRSTWIQWVPGSTPAGCGGMRNSWTTPVFGSSRPTYELRWVEYQILPLASPLTSWVAISSRGNSYLGITPRVGRPCGRGSVTKGGSLESGPRTVASQCTSLASSSGENRPRALTLTSGDP